MKQNINSRFKVEHQRAKKALKRQIDDLITTNTEDEKSLREAFYWRLGYKSSCAIIPAEEEAMISSINAVTYIDKEGEWTAFEKMMDAAKAGEIDQIETRSVFRFAVNFEELIKITEELQNLDKPVRIHFEEENITTGTREWVKLIILLFGFMEIIYEKQTERVWFEPDTDWKKIPFREERIK